MFNKKLLIHSKNVDETDTGNKTYESLRYYAMNNVADYSTITELPQSAIDYLNMVIPTDMLGCFMGCSKLKNIDLSCLTDVSQVSDFTGCFKTCTELLSITIPQWDLSNVTSTNSMFYSCTKLQDLSFVSNWNVSKVTNMGGMFAFCRGISSINLTSWDTSRVLNFYYFIGDTYITSLDLSNFNTASATDLTWMFAGSSIRNLDISNFTVTTSNVSNMFYYTSLRYLIIGSNTFKFNMTDSNCGNLNTTCKILVPSSLISTYQNATNWSSRASQFDAIENYTITKSNGQVTVTPNS